MERIFHVRYTLGTQASVTVNRSVEIRQMSSNLATTKCYLVDELVHVVSTITSTVQHWQIEELKLWARPSRSLRSLVNNVLCQTVTLLLEKPRRLSRSPANLRLVTDVVLDGACDRPPTSCPPADMIVHG